MCEIVNKFYPKTDIDEDMKFVAFLILMAMRFELATWRVTSPDSEIFTPFELQVNFTQKMLALPYQKYTFSERKFDEEFKYGFGKWGRVRY